MRRVNLIFLKPGMIVGRSIYSSYGQVLLREGTALTERYIHRLRLLGIPCVYIKDSKLGLPPVIDVISEETRINAIAKVRNMFEDSNGMGLMLKHTDSIAIVQDILAELLANKNTVVNLSDIRLDDDYLFAHSVNTCVLALLTGISLGYGRDRLHTLGLGALFHDAGKMLLPKTILNKPGHLNSEEYTVVKLHPEHGYALLKDLPTAREIAYKHHERYDGSGYPRGINGHELDDLSQITGMADVFDALTSNRQYRNAFPPREAYEFLAAGGNKLFSVELVQAFLKNVAAYPCGEVVELSDGSAAIVLETQYGFPLHPKVRLIKSAATLDLVDSGLHIVRVLPPEVGESLITSLT